MIDHKLSGCEQGIIALLSQRGVTTEPHLANPLSNSLECGKPWCECRKCEDKKKGKGMKGAAKKVKQVEENSEVESDSEGEDSADDEGEESGDDD
ncbi:MAG: hypothetical protein Q9166_004829 [cf. Caloplaca sp. 2 TL-2023]